jgi:hypothetical protein
MVFPAMLRFVQNLVEDYEMSLLNGIQMRVNFSMRNSLIRSAER